MLRGVNIGGHNKIKMDELRALYESLKFADPRTYVQSGNVIFRTKEKNSAALAKKIQDAIERKFGFRPDVILRTVNELRAAIAASPFAASRGLEPGKILVTFLAGDPGPDATHHAGSAFKGYPRGVTSQRPRTVHLLSRRRRQIQAAVVEGGEAGADDRHRPQLEQRDQDAGSGRGNGRCRMTTRTDFKCAQEKCPPENHPPHPRIQLS